MSTPTPPTPACEGYQAVATDGSYLHVARVHCNGCAESASLRERLATAEAERDELRGAARSVSTGELLATAQGRADQAASLDWRPPRWNRRTRAVRPRDFRRTHTATVGARQLDPVGRRRTPVRRLRGSRDIARVPRCHPRGDADCRDRGETAVRMHERREREGGTVQGHGGERESPLPLLRKRARQRPRGDARGREGEAMTLEEARTAVGRQVVYVPYQKSGIPVDEGVDYVGQRGVGVRPLRPPGGEPGNQPRRPASRGRSRWATPRRDDAMSTLIQELEEAAGWVECDDEACIARPSSCPTMRLAARLRQRVAWVRELEATDYPDGWKAAYRKLTGPLPAAEPCAGCLPAEGGYGDGPPPMVLGRHVEGCGNATTGGKEP